MFFAAEEATNVRYRINDSRDEEKKVFVVETNKYVQKRCCSLH
jgi:hypothetical protein